jgi:hypothetical protein
MTTIDQLLTDILKNNTDVLSTFVSNKDMRILSSIAKSVTGPNFITENQGKLLLKIFNENKRHIKEVVTDFDNVLSVPLWSRPFRPADTTKKMYIMSVNDKTPFIVIDFAYSSAIKKKLTSMTKLVSGLVQITNSKLYHAELTEKNIVVLVDAFSELKFDIDEKLKEFYQTIKSWDKNGVENQFLINDITNETLLKRLKEDIGDLTTVDENILADRSVRYQYTCKKPEKNPENLTNLMSTRSSTKVWVDSKKFSLEDIFQSITELKRFPALVVFDQHRSKNSFEELSKISEFLEKNNLEDEVGIYFRLNNDQEGKNFNQLIAQKKYNCHLSETTKLVGVQSGKIPKFLLNNNWKPMSVISIGNNLRHNKTAVYANCCDLIISYSETEPLYEPKLVWE